MIEWMDVTGIAVDVYGSELEAWTADRLADPRLDGLDGLELQMLALSTDGP